MTKPVQLFLIAAGCLLFGLAINHGTLTAGWRWDDSLMLAHAQQYHWLQDLVQPAVWQELSPANLTPLVIASYELDLKLFGLHTEAYYFHQLLALCAGAFMLVMVLRLWCPTRYALIGAVLFLCGLPVMIMAEQLMTRHYAEGLVAALLSLYGYVRFLRTGERLALVLALLLFVVACLAKEIYVPLPLLFLVLPERDWRYRCRSTAPFFLIVALYAVWRSSMLATVMGGYAPTSSYFSVELLRQVIVSFANFPRLLFGAAWLPAVMLIGISLALYYRHRLVSIWKALFVALLVFAPLAPLVQVPGILQADRYLLLVWVLVCFAVPLMAARIWQDSQGSTFSVSKVVVAVTVLALPVLSLSHGWPVRSGIAALGEEYDVQGRFILENDDTVALIPSDTLQHDFFFVDNLREVKSVLGLGTTPLVVVDDFFLPRTGSRPVYRWDSGCRCMVDFSPQVSGLLVAFDAGNRPGAALDLQYLYQGGYFNWEFGPYQEGSYRLVSDGSFNIPAPGYTGQILVNIPEGMPVYVRYSSPEGWFTYSDLLTIHRGQNVHWERP